MAKPLTKGRIRTAIAIAVIVDALQIAIQPTGPFQFLLDWPLDLVMAALMTGLIGFHWAFLPTIVAEAVPWLDVIPTWTLAVVVATRGRGEVAAEAPRDVTPPTLEGAGVKLNRAFGFGSRCRRQRLNTEGS